MRITTEKWKSEYFENLNEEKISESKTFWKTIKFILSGICVSRPSDLAWTLSLGPAWIPQSWPWPQAPICIWRPRSQFIFTCPGHWICIYRSWLIRIRNNKSESLHMFLFLFLLSNSFVMVNVDRNETKSNLSKKQIKR